MLTDKFNPRGLCTFCLFCLSKVLHQGEYRVIYSLTRTNKNLISDEDDWGVVVGLSHHADVGEATRIWRQGTSEKMHSNVRYC